MDHEDSLHCIRANLYNECEGDYEAAVVRLRLGRCSLLLGALVLASSQDAAAAENGPVQALRDLPGFDFSKLAGPSKSELAEVLVDEFDYCGKPLTLLAAIKRGDVCPHTRRMVGLAATLAAQGLSSQEILVALAKHGGGFSRPRSAFTLDDRTCQGPKGAPVTIVEFSDFECPFCGEARPMLEGFVASRKDVRLCWKPYPLAQHKFAIPASQAALLARDQGKFWAVHDGLFIGQSRMSNATIQEVLSKNGVSLKAYEKAVKAGSYVDELHGSRDEGNKAGLEVTPTLYINGRKDQLELSPETLRVSVDDEIEWMEHQGSWAPGKTVGVGAVGK